MKKWLNPLAISSLRKQVKDSLKKSNKSAQKHLKEFFKDGRKTVEVVALNSFRKAKEVVGSLVSLTENSIKPIEPQPKKNSQHEDNIAPNSNPSQVIDEFNIANQNNNSKKELIDLSKPNPSQKEIESKEIELKHKLDVIKDKYKQLKKMMNYKSKDKNADEGTRNYFYSVKKTLTQQKSFLRKVNKEEGNPNDSDDESESNYNQINEYLAGNAQLELELDQMICNMQKKVPFGNESDQIKLTNKENSNKKYYVNAFEDNEFSLFSPENHPISNDIDSIKPQTQFVTQGGDDVKDIKDLTQITQSEISKLPQESKECFICLIDFMTDNSATFLPCLHIFHSACIKDWFKKDPSCPICKHKIEGDTGNEALEG